LDGIFYAVTRSQTQPFIFIGSRFDGPVTFGFGEYWQEKNELEDQARFVMAYGGSFLLPMGAEAESFGTTDAPLS
jgi:hypothetical protein